MEIIIKIATIIVRFLYYNTNNTQALMISINIANGNNQTNDSSGGENVQYR